MLTVCCWGGAGARFHRLAMSSVELNPETLLRDALRIAQAVKKHVPVTNFGLEDTEWPSDVIHLVEQTMSHPMVRSMSPAEYCSVLRVLYYFWTDGGVDAEVYPETDDEGDDEDEEEDEERPVKMRHRYWFWFDDAEPHDNLMPKILQACDLADGMDTFAPLPEGYDLKVFLKNFHEQGCPGLVPMAAIVLMLELIRITADVFMGQADLADLLLQLAEELIVHIESHDSLFGGDSGAPAPVATAVAAAAAAPPPAEVNDEPEPLAPPAKKLKSSLE